MKLCILQSAKSCTDAHKKFVVSDKSTDSSENKINLGQIKECLCQKWGITVLQVTVLDILVLVEFVTPLSTGIVTATVQV